MNLRKRAAAQYEARRRAPVLAYLAKDEEVLYEVRAMLIGDVGGLVANGYLYVTTTSIRYVSDWPRPAGRIALEARFGVVQEVVKYRKLLRVVCNDQPTVRFQVPRGSDLLFFSAFCAAYEQATGRSF